MRERIRSLAISIRRLGVGAALAMAATRTDPEGRELYRRMERRLCRDETGAPYPGRPRLLEAIRNHDEAAALHARDEALRYLGELLEEDR